MVVFYIQVRASMPLSPYKAIEANQNLSQVMTKGKGDPNKVSPSENLATMLPEFFEYFGQQFDYVANVISVSEGGKFVSKEEKKWVHEDRPDSLAVQDPLVPGSSSSTFIGVLFIFIFPVAWLTWHLLVEQKTMLASRASASMQ
jgi:DNA polymerase sigma